MKSQYYIIGMMILVLLINVTVKVPSQSTLDMKYLNVDTTPSIDGTIEPKEYKNSKNTSNGEYQLYWQIEEEIIYWGILVKTNGWIAIGFDPTTAMKDADMIFAWVENDQSIEIRDCYSTGTYGPHPPDTDLGGTSDILIYNASEGIEITTIEFSRLLITGDTYDKDIPSSGSFDIIWAIGITDDFNQKHSKKGEMIINMGNDKSSTSTLNTSILTSTSFSSGIDFTIIIITLFGLVIIYKKTFYKKT